MELPAVGECSSWRRSLWAKSVNPSVVLATFNYFFLLVFLVKKTKPKKVKLFLVVGD